MTNTKEYIVDQAYKLFLNHSYEAVTISEISKAIGLTKGALYHHFVSKEELFKAVIDKYLNINAWDIDTQYESLYQFIEHTISHTEQIIKSIFGEKPGFIPVNYLSLLIDALRHYPGFETEKELLFSTQLSRIKLVMQRAVDTGEIRDDLDIDITAINFFSVYIGLSTNLYTHKSSSLALEVFSQQLYEFYRLLKK